MGRGSVRGPGAPGVAGQGAQRLSVRSVGRRVRVIGDRSVVSATVSGPHVLRRSGQTLEVAGQEGGVRVVVPELGAFAAVELITGGAAFPTSV